MHFFSATLFTIILVKIVYIKYVINIRNKNLCGTYVYLPIHIQYKLAYIQTYL